MKTIIITKAEYVSGYCIKLSFSDGKENIVDFERFLKKDKHPSYRKYLDLERFKQFYIDSNLLVWNEDWDLVFPTPYLYKVKRPTL